MACMQNNSTPGYLFIEVYVTSYINWQNLRKYSTRESLRKQPNQYSKSILHSKYQNTRKSLTWFSFHALNLANKPNYKTLAKTRPKIPTIIWQDDFFYNIWSFSHANPNPQLRLVLDRNLTQDRAIRRAQSPSWQIYESEHSFSAIIARFEKCQNASLQN